MSSSVSNLFFRYPDLNPRRLPPKDTSALQQARLETCAAIKESARAVKNPYVLPKRFHVTMTVTAQANAAPSAQVIPTWHPLPRRNPFQAEFVFISTSP